MEAATLPEQAEAPEEGAPVEQGAEATRTADHLFQYSMFVHAGDVEDCEHATDGQCQDKGHFHAWVCLPNRLQHRDIQEKARAAKARRKRALRDAGSDTRPASDAHVTLESELDDLMGGDREKVLEELAERTVRRSFGDIVLDVKEDDRFETYEQDSEEYRRLAVLDEDERDAEEFQRLDDRMTEFANVIDERVKRQRDDEMESMRGMSEDAVRDLVRQARISGEGEDASINSYYTWVAFVGTRKVPGGISAKRYFETLDDLRNAPPEAVVAIDDAIRDLEGRMARGDAAGN